jgi:cytosine/adenosine deaminase-related metal-dependent hydrolase
MVIENAASWGLLGPDILLSHATGATAEEAKELVKAGVHISATPGTELQMSHGDPTCFRPDLFEISSLGVDCHSVCSAEIPVQMRLALTSARGIQNQRVLDKGKTPLTMPFSVEQAYNLGTIMGARAVGMGSEIGSLAEGKLADIVIFDASSPAMACAAQYDPVDAIVLHSSLRDIDTVIVDGIVRKQSGKLLPVHIDQSEKVMQWKDVAAELLKSRAEIEEKYQKIDLTSSKKNVNTAFYIQTHLMGDE